MGSRLEDTFQNSHSVVPGYHQNFLGSDSVVLDMRDDLNVFEDETEQHYS